MNRSLKEARERGKEEPEVLLLYSLASPPQQRKHYLREIGISN